MLSGKNKNSLSATLRLKENDFYFVKWKKGENEWQQSDYFQINIIADNSPSIQVKELENYSSYSYDSTKTITLKARVEDDYGICHFPRLGAGTYETVISDLFLTTRVLVARLFTRELGLVVL